MQAHRSTPLTGNAYRGGNCLVLGMVAASRGWSSHWSTYHQWTQLGAQVRRGEKATHGVKWSQVEDKLTGKRRMVPFTFTVFSADQVDGWEPPASLPRDTPERIEAAGAFITSLAADVRQRREPGGLLT